jgi:hypothetical protein
MRKRKWALLILAIILIAGYVKFFYKTWNENAVPASADFVVALDVKRITNTLIWNFITTPGQWRTGKLFPKKGKDTSWRDMIKLPDYIFAFHSKDQPAKNWYVLLEMKNRKGFEEGLKKFEFEKLQSHEYISRSAGLYLIIQDEKVLAGKASFEDSNLVRKVAKELFTDKKFIVRSALEHAVDAKSHLAVFMATNRFLQKPGIISADFNKEKISIRGVLTPAGQFDFREEVFLFPTGSLSVLGFTQPSPLFLELLGKTGKEKISSAMNLHIDSVLAESNTSYSLNLEGIKERADSAITYTYDDEFNKVEQLVVNNIQEPSFAFFINGKDISAVYNYLQRNNKLESTAGGDLFLPMPLVKSYCRKKTGSTLTITAFNYSAPAGDTGHKAVLYFQLALSKIPSNLFRYLPDALTKGIENLDELNFSVTKKNEQLQVTGMLTKKKNSLSIFKF